MTGGGKGRGKKADRLSKPNKPPPRTGAAVKGLVDLGSPLIKMIPFDHFNGNYEALIPDLREIFSSYDPEKSPSLMSDYFGVVFGKEGAPKERRMIAYLQKLDAYFLAFYNKKLYEYGIGNKAKKFLKSTFVGYEERYTKSMLDNLLVGYYPLRDGIEKMMDQAEGNEDPDKGVLFGWMSDLIVIMVMLCEASRYHPIFRLTLDLWNRKTEKKLPQGLIVYMQNWSKASAIASGQDRGDNGHQPPGVLDYDDISQAKLMVESKLGAKSVLAFSHRGKKSGEGTSRGN